MLVWLALFFAMSGAGTWLARRYALQHRLLDQPGERRSHSVPTPRGGGIAIVAALLAAAIALALRFPAQASLLAAFAIGLAAVAAVGWLDDHRPLSLWWRLLVHGLAAALFALALALGHATPWAAVAAFASILVLTNVWNFMDGIDGLATSQAAIVAAAFGLVLGGPWAMLAWALLAACLGFLPFNFPRARIFLGDVGSGALGFALAALLGVAWSSGRPHSMLLLLPLAPFLIDAGLTLLRRLARGERWWTPHTQHAYQAWARRRGHLAVTLAYGATTIFALALMLGVWNSYLYPMVVALATWYTSCAFFWWWLQRGPRVAGGHVQRTRE